MRGFKFLAPLTLALFAFTSEAEAPYSEFCGIDNRSFKAGEQITYTVYYAVAGIYVNAGNATFHSQLETFNNRPVYHITGEGKTNSSYDWI